MLFNTSFAPNPFGSPMDGRVFSGEKYRFGFNGMEKVKEITGFDNHYTALYGEYDSRVVFRWNTDTKPVAWESPYAMFRDNPIWYNDPLLDYSKLDAKWRNFINGGNGISHSQTTGEWGYEKGIKDGVEYRDGLTKTERQNKINEFKKENVYIDKLGWIKVGTIRTYTPDFYDKWSEDKSIIGKSTNGIADNWSVTLQNIFIKNWGDGNAYHLNGEMTNTTENVDGFVGIATDLVPSVKVAKGLPFLKKINTAQFSKIFKGNLSRLSPSTKGFINRTINKFVNPINDKISSADIVEEGIDLIPKPNKDAK